MSNIFSHRLFPQLMVTNIGRHRSLQSRFFAVLSLLFMSAVLSANASAQTTVIVTASNPQGFRTIATTGTGTVTFVTDANAPAGAGALQLTTPDATAKADFFRATSTLLTDVTELSYFTEQQSGSPSIADPAYQLRVCLNGLNAMGNACNPSLAGGTSFSTLVFEPYLNPGNNGNATIVPDVYQQYDVDAGLFYSTRTVECSGGTLVGSQGSPLYTLAEIKAACPATLVFDFGVNIGSNNAGYVVRTDLLRFNDMIFNFEPAAPTAANASMSGRVTSRSGASLAGVVVALLDVSNGETFITLTNSEGIYRFENGQAGNTYVITPSLRGYTFNERSKSLSITEDTSGIDFIAIPDIKSRKSVFR